MEINSQTNKQTLKKTTTSTNEVWGQSRINSAIGAQRRTDFSLEFDLGRTKIGEEKWKNVVENKIEFKAENKHEKWMQKQKEIARKWVNILGDDDREARMNCFDKMIGNVNGEEPIQLVPKKDKEIGRDNLFQKNVFHFLSKMNIKFFSDYDPKFGEEDAKEIKEQMLYMFVKDTRFLKSSQSEENQIKIMMETDREAFNRILRFVEAQTEAEELFWIEERIDRNNFTETELREMERKDEEEIISCLKSILGNEVDEKKETRKNRLMGIMGSRVSTVLTPEKRQVEGEFPQWVINFLSGHTGHSLEKCKVLSEKEGTGMLGKLLEDFEKSIWLGEISKNKLNKAMKKDKEEFRRVLKFLVKKYESQIQKDLWQSELKTDILKQLKRAEGEATDNISLLKKHIEDNICRIELNTLKEIRNYASLENKERVALKKQIQYEMLGFEGGDEVSENPAVMLLEKVLDLFLEGLGKEPNEN